MKVKKRLQITAYLKLKYNFSSVEEAESEIIEIFKIQKNYAKCIVRNAIRDGKINITFDLATFVNSIGTIISKPRRTGYTLYTGTGGMELYHDYIRKSSDNLK